jgi:adenylosuccinate lyase
VITWTSLNPGFTASTQWFERTLDDSAPTAAWPSPRLSSPGRRHTQIYTKRRRRLVVYPKVINQRVMRELPFMASENIMMSAVKKGGDRQELHERIREHSLAAAQSASRRTGSTMTLSHASRPIRPSGSPTASLTAYSTR